jgi:L-ascorbate metabolism protein UlaG (beta-lactamase superfamily)
VADLVTQTCELELSIGDTIQVGDQFLTVVDIEGDEILFQLDTDNPAERDATASSVPRSCR